MHVTVCEPLPGETLRVREGGRRFSVVLGDLVAEQGGYGLVYKGECRRRGGEPFPVAVKFLRPETDCEDEIWSKRVCRFKQESRLLRWFCLEYAKRGKSEWWLPSLPPFPVFYGKGIHDDLPFYVMEWLRPVNLWSDLTTNDRRLTYMREVCYSVIELHCSGYVHYDLKPGNIMTRKGADGNAEYVLVDFGSLHKAEKGQRTNGGRDKSISLLSDGRRVYPHTPGYADPLDDLHTVNADIYAIGQIIRDLFPETMPPGWAFVSNKCMSRNMDYRYTSVSDILDDLEHIKPTEYDFAALDDINIWRAQKKVAEERPFKMSWDELMKELASQREFMRVDDDYPSDGLFIDFGKFTHRNIWITTPVHLPQLKSALLVIRGNGRISLDMDGTGISGKDLEHQPAGPVYPLVILLDGATLENRTKLDNEDAWLMYMVGRYCMLRFSSRPDSEVADDPRYILKGRAGYSFVTNGSKQGGGSLWNVLESGRKKLFVQQGWDDLTVTTFLKRLRKSRRHDAQGAVQDWLEMNARNVLMRNLGRYDLDP